MSKAVLVHGEADRHHVPLRLETGGVLQDVVSRTYRMDLQIAAWWRKEPRSYWECTVADDTTLVVYHDLTKGGWYRESTP